MSVEARTQGSPSQQHQFSAEILMYGTLSIFMIPLHSPVHHICASSEATVVVYNSFVRFSELLTGWGCALRSGQSAQQQTALS